MYGYKLAYAVLHYFIILDLLKILWQKYHSSNIRGTNLMSNKLLKKLSLYSLSALFALSACKPEPTHTRYELEDEGDRSKRIWFYEAIEDSVKDKFFINVGNPFKERGKTILQWEGYFHRDSIEKAAEKFKKDGTIPCYESLR